MENLTLGELIQKLKACKPETPVLFDFGGLAPGNVASYRGYYNNLAIDFDPESGYGDATVEKLLQTLENAVGATFTGWKGGEYRMTTGTPMWVANPGRSSGTAVVGVRDLNYLVVLETAYID